MNFTDAKIGRYEVRRKIGGGGMGEVYLAHDAELNRAVALKILPGEFSDDDVRRHRFKQEARAVSALNHPNILTIYEIGKAENGWFIATEYVEGQTLREYLQDSPLGIAQAVRISGQIAEALAAAHDSGIIHRDIKPENIMIRRDGYVKVLDFGLAKPSELPKEGYSENTTARIVNTEPGMVMGSVRYMSPEQARGLAVDARTDIWSLGAVLYEMLTGRSPFQAATTSDTIAALIHLAPAPLERLAPNAPAELRCIIGRSLQKERDERYQNVRDMALDLKNLFYDLDREISAENRVRRSAETSDFSENRTMIHDTSSANHSTAPQNASSAEYVFKQIKSHKWQALSIGLTLIVLLAAFGFANRFLDDDEATAAFEKTQVSRLNSDGKARLPAISPDGKYVAYLSGEAGNRSLVVRQVAADNLVTIVPPSPLEIKTINFSFDGNYVLYTQLSPDYTFGTLYQIPALGGTPKKIGEDVDSEVSFAPDGKQFAFLRHSTREGGDLIIVADSDGANPRQIINSKQTEFNFFTTPAWSPDGARILVGAGKNEVGTSAPTNIVEISPNDGSHRLFETKKWNFLGNLRWLKNGAGFLMRAKETDSSPIQIWLVNYPSGDAQPVTNDSNNYQGLSLSSDTGTLVTIKSESIGSLWDFSPATKDLTQLTADNSRGDGEAGVAQMPDGETIFTRRSDKEINLWKTDASGKNERQLTAEAGFNVNPVVTPDGLHIVFGSSRSGESRIWRIDADGKNPVQLTAGSNNERDSAPQISADGKTVVFQRIAGQNSRSMFYKVSIEGGESVNIFDDGQTMNFHPRLSPGGDQIAFVSYNPTTFERKLQIAEFTGESVGQITKGINYNLMNTFQWSLDGKSLTYLSNDGIPNIWRLPLDGGKPQPVTEFKSGVINSYILSNDGKRLLIARAVINSDLILIRDIAPPS